MNDIIQGMLMAQAELSARLFEDFDSGIIRDFNHLKKRYKAISYLEASVDDYINTKALEEAK